MWCEFVCLRRIPQPFEQISKQVGREDVSQLVDGRALRQNKRNGQPRIPPDQPGLVSNMLHVANPSSCIPSVERNATTGHTHIVPVNVVCCSFTIAAVSQIELSN